MSRQAPGMTDPALRASESAQISLSDALAKIDRTIEPVAAREIAPAEGLGFVLAADAVVAPATKLRLAGARLRTVDVALLAAHAVAHVSIRVPRIAVVAPSHHAEHAICALIAGAIRAEGGAASVTHATLDEALKYPDYDAVIAIGEEAQIDQIVFDGVALAPGGATAFGNSNGRPLLRLSAEFDDALAGWLAIGRRLLARLAFRLIEEQPFLLELARPIASPRGLAQLITVRRRAAQVEPVLGEWTPQSFSRSDGWILVPAESEGISAGTKVQMRPWP